jgi:hypothetical protein
MKEITENNPIKSKNSEYQPPIEMRRFVTVLLNEGGGNQTETERITKIDKWKFWYHLRRAKNKEEFQRWYVQQVDAFFVTYEVAVGKTLLKKIADGDVQAMRLYYELRGRIKAGGVNIAATALPGARQPLVIVFDKSEEQESASPPIDTTVVEEGKKGGEKQLPVP